MSEHDQIKNKIYEERLAHNPLAGSPEWWEQEKLKSQPYAGSQPISEFEADQLAHDAEHNIDFVWGAESAKERRNRIAEGFAFALADRGYAHKWMLLNLPREAIELAEVLIAELDK